MWSYFAFKNITYNIRNGPLLKLHDAKSLYYGIKSVHFRACLLRNGLPQSVKHSESIFELKIKLKKLLLPYPQADRSGLKKPKKGKYQH